jgi:hypothetical protein
MDSRRTSAVDEPAEDGKRRRELVDRQLGGDT